MHVKNMKSKTGTRSSPRSTYSIVELRGMISSLAQSNIKKSFLLFILKGSTSNDGGFQLIFPSSNMNNR